MRTEETVVVFVCVCVRESSDHVQFFHVNFEFLLVGGQCQCRGDRQL